MVQKHDNRVRVSFFCHPEPGPELDSGSIDFGISVLGFKNLGFKAPPCGQGSLLRICIVCMFLNSIITKIGCQVLFPDKKKILDKFF